MHPRYIQSLLNSLEARMSRWDRGDGGPGNIDERQLRRIINLMEKMMATLDETLARVTASGDRLDSLIQLQAGLKKQLEDALAGLLTPEMQAKIDAIFAEADENVAKTDAALNTNVPPPPPA